MKSCAYCGEGFAGRRADARYCSDACGASARSKRHAARHPEKIAARLAALRERAASEMLARVKHRAKRCGIPFDLAAEDSSIPEVCPILGIRLSRNNGRGHHPSSPSLGRIVPSRGYVRGNVRVISARANPLKNDATVEELEAVLGDLRKIAA